MAASALATVSALQMIRRSKHDKAVLYIVEWFVRLIILATHILFEHKSVWASAGRFAVNRLPGGCITVNSSIACKILVVC